MKRLLAVWVLVALAGAPCPALAAWTITPFDNSNNAGWGTSLRVDGIPRVSYWAPGFGFRYFDGTTYMSADIPFAPSPPDAVLLIRFGSTALALDPGGEPWIVQTWSDTDNFNNGYTRVVHRVDGMFVGDIGLGPTFRDPSIDVERPSGVVHLLYEPSAGTTYAWRDGSGWHFELFDSIGAYGEIRLDRHNRLGFAYTLGGRLYFARRVGGAWQSQLVDGAHHAGSVSLSYNGLSQPRIAYVDVPGGSVYQLRYAEENLGTWTTQAITPAGGSVSDYSLAVGGGDHPYVAFGDFSLNQMRVAWRESGTWQAETVDPTLGAGQYPSMAFDNSATPIIAYRGDIGQGGRLATGSRIVGVDGPPARAPGLALLGANPVRAGDAIALSLTSAIDQVVRLEAFDASGRVIGEAREIGVRAGLNRIEWTGRTTAGLLFLQARSSSGVRWTARIVVL